MLYPSFPVSHIPIHMYLHFFGVVCIQIHFTPIFQYLWKIINIQEQTIVFSDHLAEKINKANRLMGLIRTFVSLDEEIFKSVCFIRKTTLRVGKQGLGPIYN